jgi:hypothetical protein
VAARLICTSDGEHTTSVIPRHGQFLQVAIVINARLLAQSSRISARANATVPR